MKNCFLCVSILLMGAFISFTSCENKNKKSESTVATETILEVDDVLQSSDSLVGKLIVMEGVCTHICSHGGKKMFLMGSDDSKTMRVDAAEKIGSFPSDVVNSMVAVTGVLLEERIDEAAIRTMEEQYASQQNQHHGEDVEAGCATEKTAHGQEELDSFAQRMQDYRVRIAARKAKEGKEYLSFYAVTGESYKVL